MPVTSRFFDGAVLAGDGDRPWPAMPAQAPSRRRQIANFVVFQAAWFAVVLGAAHGWPAWGTAAAVAAMAWHVIVSVRPRAELALLASVCAIGLVDETMVVLQGHIAYASGQPVAWLPPYWLVSLWGLFGIALNVTLRWLKHRPALAVALGAIAGPLSFVSGVHLGGARFVDPVPALLTLACTWGVLMPVLMALADRFDGVAAPASGKTPSSDSFPVTPHA